MSDAAALQRCADVGFPAQTVVNPQMGRHAPAVLGVEPDVLVALVVNSDARLSLGCGQSKQEIGHRQARELSRKARTSPGGSEKGAVLNRADVVHAKLKLVIAAQHAEVIGDLMALGRQE